MRGIYLSQEESEILKTYFKTSQIALIRNKALTINLADQKIDPKEIAKGIFVSERSVRRWLLDFRRTRLSSLFSGKENNQNASKLTASQKEEIKQVLGSSPEEKGLPKTFWEVPDLKEYLWAQFGVVYESERSYHFLLEFAGLSFKYPDKFDQRRNEAGISKRIREIRKEMRPLQKDPNWEVLCSDETRVVLEALTRKAWLKRNKRTVIKVNRKKDYQNYLGLLSLKSFEASLFRLDWQNQEEIIQALEAYAHKCLYPRICLIWDNAAFHKGALIRQELRKGGRLERFHLISLPPYAPDQNPVEQIWNKAKGVIANNQFEDFNLTKSRFEQAVTSRKYRYRLTYKKP